MDIYYNNILYFVNQIRYQFKLGIRKSKSIFFQKGKVLLEEESSGSPFSRG